MRIPKDARAIVTGAGSGFGRAVSQELAKRGARVLASDLDLASAEATAKDIGGKAMKADVRDARDVEALVRFAEHEWGGVDILVNNAGVAVVGRVGEVSLEDWRFEVDVNLMGVIYGCHYAVPVMRKQKRGWILNVASAAGLLSAPMMAPYNVTKAGVVAMTETLRAELKNDGVSVSVLCPTFFRTNIHKAQRSPEDLRAKTEKLVTQAKWSAEEIAKVAVDGLERGTLYVIPQADGKIMWRAKRALGQRFYTVVGLMAGRVISR